jgi:hypothetical protein
MTLRRRDRSGWLLLLLACTALHASATFAQTDPVRPAATSEVGPWEAVVWTRGRTVIRCTLSRAQPTADGYSYGFLADREGLLLGVEHKSWTFASNAGLPATLTPQSGGERKLSARPATPTRANFELPRPMLDQLQRSEHLDVQIGARKARLPFDDFNAARVVLEACVQQLGKEHQPGR